MINNEELLYSLIQTSYDNSILVAHDLAIELDCGLPKIGIIQPDILGCLRLSKQGFRFPAYKIGEYGHLFALIGIYSWRAARTGINEYRKEITIYWRF